MFVHSFYIACMNQLTIVSFNSSYRSISKFEIVAGNANKYSYISGRCIAGRKTGRANYLTHFIGKIAARATGELRLS